MSFFDWLIMRESLKQVLKQHSLENYRPCDYNVLRKELIDILNMDIFDYLAFGSDFVQIHLPIYLYLPSLLFKINLFIVKIYIHFLTFYAFLSQSEWFQSILVYYPLFPLFLSFLCFFIFFFRLFFQFDSKKVIAFWTSFFLSSIFGCALFIFWEVIYTSQHVFDFFGASWISVSYLNVNWTFTVDSLVAVMYVVVCGISFLVHLYSLDYMYSDLGLARFISFLSLFTFFMLFLVTAGNFVQLFFGWEGVGLASYLLINFWYTRIEANKSAIKAILVNRIGDIGLYLAIVGCVFLYKSVDFAVIFSLPHLSLQILFPGFNFTVLDFINFCIFIGAAGKSAQLGLHTWLPDAMEGPTPVSALIHAATMVTAGVFILIRFSPLLEFSPFVLNCIIWIGAFTTLFAASVGCFQNDIKKIIAYSTCSQLGYMFIACGLSAYNVALFHLFNHAFFKALLFLGAGSVIHSLHDEQDIRRMGDLWYYAPVTFITMCIGSLSLAGFPFFSGFYSKDYILELALVSPEPMALFGFCAGVVTVFLTAFYSFRLIYYVFLGCANGQRNKFTESSNLILFVLFILALASLFTGFFFK